jgi:hypothetical protein
VFSDNAAVYEGGRYNKPGKGKPELQQLSKKGRTDKEQEKNTDF